MHYILWVSCSTEHDLTDPEVMKTMTTKWHISQKAGNILKVVHRLYEPHLPGYTLSTAQKQKPLTAGFSICGSWNFTILRRPLPSSKLGKHTAQQATRFCHHCGRLHDAWFHDDFMMILSVADFMMQDLSSSKPHLTPNELWEMISSWTFSFQPPSFI